METKESERTYTFDEYVKQFDPDFRRRNGAGYDDSLQEDVLKIMQGKK